MQFGSQRILWRSIKLFDDLSIRSSIATYPYTLDAAMIAQRRRIPLLGAQVLVLAPENVLVHKLAMGRGADQGKHDIADAAGIARRQKLDLEYMRQRAATMKYDLAPALAHLSIALKPQYV